MMKINVYVVSLLMVVPLYASEQSPYQPLAVESSADVRVRREDVRRCVRATCCIGTLIAGAIIGTGLALYPVVFPKDKPSTIQQYRYVRIIGSCGSCQDPQTWCIRDQLANETDAHESKIIDTACAKNNTGKDWRTMYLNKNSQCQSLETAMDKIKAKCGNHTGAMPSTVTLKEKLQNKRKLMANQRAGRVI